MGSLWYGYRVHEQEIIISTSNIKVLGFLSLSFVFFNASLISVLYFAEGQDLEDLILSWVCLVIFGCSCIVGSASLFREGVPKLRISEEKLMFEQGFVNRAKGEIFWKDVTELEIGEVSHNGFHSYTSARFKIKIGEIVKSVTVPINFYEQHVTDIFQLFDNHWQKSKSLHSK